MIINIQRFLLTENIKQAKEYIKKLGIKNPDDEPIFAHIKNKLQSLPNLIGHFVKLAFTDENAMAQTLDDIMDWIVNNRALIGQLPKNINQYNTIEELEDDIHHLKQNSQIKKFYNNLYSSMRKAVDELDEENKKKFDELALEYVALPEETKKLFTPLKYFEANNISIEDFIIALEKFINKETINDDKKAVLEKLKNYEGKYKIPYNENDVLVVQSNNQELVCDIGSQNWCIVYSPDTYAKSYFGPETTNTQYIVFNFNLPSSAANSMFGITIDEDGKAKSGGCQNKLNRGVSLESVYEMTGIPVGTIKPTEEILKRKEDRNEIIDFFTNNVLSLNDISNFYKENDFEYELFMGIVKKYISNNKNHYFYKTFQNKILDDVIKILDDNFIKDILFELYSTLNYIDYSILLDCTNDVSYYLILSYFNTFLSKYDIDRLYGNLNNYRETAPSLVSRTPKEDYKNLLDRLSVDKNTIKNLYEKMDISIDSNTMWGIFNEFFKETKDRIVSTLISLDNSTEFNTNSFTLYKEIYDEYITPYENIPYEGIFGYYDNFENLVYLFYDSSGFTEFFTNVINSNKKEIKSPTVIEDLFSLGNVSNTDDYDLLENSNYQNFIVKIIEGTNSDMSDIVKTNDLVGLFLYNHTNKYNKLFKERIGVETDENGVDYIEVSDFTSFDDLIFGEEYFNNLDDYTMDNWWEADEATLEYWFDDLDDYNIIYIAYRILQDSPDFKNIISPNMVNEFLTLSENMKINDKKVKVPKNTLANEYDSNENIKIIKSKLKEIIFDNDELYDKYDIDYIDTEIKGDILNRALNDAQSSAQYDYIWNSLIDAIGDILGGNNWTKDDEAIPRIKGNSIYKFKDSKLLFTIDVSYLVDNIKSYGDLYWNLGNEFDWENLTSYVAKELGSATNMDHALENSSNETISKKTFNDAVRNI